MPDIYLIRHGMTEGNKKQRYIGTTDEPLCPEGKAALTGIDCPEPESLFCKPAASMPGNGRNSVSGKNEGNLSRAFRV